MPPWKQYNDTAPGAQPGYALALTLTLPDGSQQEVRFDGIEGDYVIDRKWSIVDSARGREQAFRQSAALEQQRLFATWEIPSQQQKTRAIQFLKKLGIRNIKVRMVAP